MNPVAQKYGASALAGVNLLPKEIAEKKRMRSVQFAAAMAVLAVLGVMVLWFLAEFALKAAASADRDSAVQDEAAAIAARDSRVQVFYDVQQREVGEYTLAQVGYGEIDYASLTSVIQSAFQADVRLNELTVTGPNAVGTAAVETDPGTGIFGIGVGTITFTARATSQETATAALAALEAVPGIANVVGSAEAYAQDGETVFWEVTGQATLTDALLTGRLLPEGGITGVEVLVRPAPEPSASPSAEPSPGASAGAEEN